MRKGSAILLSLALAISGSVLADASAAAKAKGKPKGKSCGTVTPKHPENSGGGFGAFKVSIVKGKVSCTVAKSLFDGFYVSGKTTFKHGKTTTKIDGYTCTGGAPPSRVVTCTRKKVTIKGEDV